MVKIIKRRFYYEFNYLSPRLAVMGVSLGEGILVANIAKAAARQPEMFSKLQTLMFTGVAFIEGTFFVLFALSYIV